MKFFTLMALITLLFVFVVSKQYIEIQDLNNLTYHQNADIENLRYQVTACRQLVRQQ